jgi:hypothetical protein
MPQGYYSRWREQGSPAQAPPTTAPTTAPVPLAPEGFLSHFYPEGRTTQPTGSVPGSAPAATPANSAPATGGTSGTSGQPAAGSGWGTLDDWNLDPATQARMERHIEGGGRLGLWQLGARPPGYEAWSQMSQTERNLLGLPTTWELHLAAEAHQDWVHGRGAWEGLGPRWNPGDQYSVGGQLGWATVPDISWNAPPTEWNYTNPQVPDWLQGTRPDAPEYVPNGPYDTGTAPSGGGGGTTAPPSTPAAPDTVTRYPSSIPAPPSSVPSSPTLTRSDVPIDITPALAAPDTATGLAPLGYQARSTSAPLSSGAASGGMTIADMMSGAAPGSSSTQSSALGQPVSLADFLSARYRR